MIEHDLHKYKVPNRWQQKLIYRKDKTQFNLYFRPQFLLQTTISTPENIQLIQATSQPDKFIYNKKLKI